MTTREMLEEAQSLLDGARFGHDERHQLTGGRCWQSCPACRARRLADAIRDALIRDDLGLQERRTA